MKDEDEVVATYKGTPVTKAILDDWDEAYSSAEIPAGYTRDGGVRVGRPPLVEGSISSIAAESPQTGKSP